MEWRNCISRECYHYVVDFFFKLFQIRILSIISGAILPVVALGFIKSLVDYIKPTNETTEVEALREAYKKAWEENPPIDNDEELETASLADLESFLGEEESQPLEEPITPEIMEFLEKNGELTKEDIENYKKSTKNKGGEDGINPQILPGVN